MVLTFVFSANAQGEGITSTGGISGQVTRAQDGAPIAAAQVYVYTADGDYVNFTNTDSGGGYAFTGLTPGSYKVYAQSGILIGEYYNGRREFSQADTITVTSGSTTSGINFSLKRWVTISGTVYASDGVTPLVNAQVYIYNADGDVLNVWDTDDSGVYSMNFIYPEPIRVSARKTGYVEEFYNNQATLAGANVLTPSEGDLITGINFTLDASPVITGTVYEIDGVTPIAGVSVYATRISDSAYGGFDTTAADGTYRLTVDSGAGQYRVETFADGYSYRAYDNKRSWNTATPVTVQVNTTTSGINFRLPRSASLSGTVFQPDGTTPVGSAEVQLIDTVSGIYYYTYTQTNGTFALNAVEPGTYYVYARSSTFGEVYHDQKPTTSGATVFTLPNGGSITGVSVRFLPPATISGTISVGGGGAGASGDTDLAAFHQPRPYQAGSRIERIETLDVEAQYQAQRGEPLSLLVAREMAERERIGGILSDPLSLIAPLFTPLDVPLRQDGDALTAGALFDPASLAGATVWARNQVSGQSYSTTTGTGGSYSLTGLPAGRYTVNVNAPGYVSEYYDNVYSSSYAPQIIVAPGETATVNMSIDPAGTVTGRVFAPDGVTPLANVQVYWDASFYDRIVRCTNAMGEYTLPDAPVQNTFTVVVDGTQTCSSTPLPYTRQTYLNGQPLHFPTGVTTLSNINFTMQPGGSITGTVYRSDGTTPVPFAYLYVYDLTYTYMGFAQTNASGQYTFTGLPTGGYKINLNSGSIGGYAWVSEWYQDKQDFAQATVVNVTAGSTTSGVHIISNPALAGTGSISGRVVKPDGTTGDPATWVYLYRRNVDRYFYISGQRTAADGTFSFTNLSPAEYVIEALPDNYAREYYQNQTSLGSATSIVSSNNSVTGIIIQLDPGTSVSGTIYDGQTGRPWAYPSVTIYTQSGSFVTSLTGRENGTFTTYLPAGTYIAYADDYPYGAGRFYGGASDIAGAAPFTVNGTPVTAIDITLGRQGEITGRITTSDGVTPIGGRSVTISPVGAWTRYSTCNNGSGYYTSIYGQIGVANIVSAQGQCGSTGNYAPEWWQEATTRDGATPVNLNSSRRLATNINFTLTPGGSLSGHVYAADGVTPLSEAWVYAYLKVGDTYEFIDSDTTDVNGAYTIQNLGTGQYVVYTFRNGYVPETYNNRPGFSLSSGDLVNVTVGADTPGINFSLSPLGTTADVTLTLTPQGTRPPKPHSSYVMSAQVIIKPVGGGAAIVNSTYTSDENGQITLIGLPPGAYTVWVKGANTLSVMSEHTLVIGANTISTGLLRSGDADASNSVTLSDFTVLANTFGKAAGAPGYDGRADFNGDGQVTITDFSLLVGNFGATGTPAP
jgi:hypothetical protein